MQDTGMFFVSSAIHISLSSCNSSYLNVSAPWVTLYIHTLSICLFSLYISLHRQLVHSFFCHIMFRETHLVNCDCNLLKSTKSDLFIRTPNPSVSPSLPFFPTPSHFLHRLQTSITQSFLRPFFKNRRHVRSAHTFGSSLQFLEVPQKGFFLLHF